MRNELEQIATIEQYLDGRLTGPERAAFEAELAGSPALQEAVKLQQEIMKGIERAALKEKVQQAGRQFRQWRDFRRWGTAGMGIIIIAAAVFYFSYKMNQHGHYGSDESGYAMNGLPALNEQGETQWADADRNIAAQQFLINADRDTVIETKGGMVLSIPANGFLDENGQRATGHINLVLKEALSPAAIMKAGLSSKSGDQLLESGGMFFIDARQNGRALKIDSSHGIYAEIPADTAWPGMQLYHGRRMKDGTIDWVTPRPLEHGLMPVDIQALQFYPPGYLDSLAKWGYGIKNKKFTDSLYYSFARLFGKIQGLPIQTGAVESDYVGDTLISKRDIPADTSTEFHPLHDCAINPAKIKAIWNDHFQNTLLSTREFEERMFWIHVMGQNDVLDLYINNLDKNLSDIDSMVAARYHFDGAMMFKFFAARHDGKVKNGSRQFQRLREYYELKTRAYTEAIAKTQNDYWRKQAQLDQTAGRKRLEHQDDSLERSSKNFEEELAINFKEAFRQLGHDESVAPLPPGPNVYRTTIITTGWCNIDRAVIASTTDRATLDFIDPQNGKKAVIKYLPVSVQVSAFSEYDRLYVYLLPTQLSSYMRLSGDNGKYAEKLNELISYKLVCIGYKGEQAFFYSADNIQPKDYPPVALAAISSGELDRELNKAGNKTQASGLVKENTYYHFEQKDQKRQQHNRELEELRDKLIRRFFPCYLPQQFVGEPGAEGPGMEYMSLMK